MTRVRFAPSPTGHLHVGNARIAIFNWLFAQKNKGHFLLRLDDTDKDRATEAFADEIIDDMQWMGLTIDSIEKQSNRVQKYDAALEYLKGTGDVYECFDTAEELETKRKIQIMQGRPPIYDRNALMLTRKQKDHKIRCGIRPHWRFKLKDTVVEWHDMTRGKVRLATKHLSDPILIRADGQYLYTLCSVVDDVDMHITHVIRGADHLTNTAIQILLFRALHKEVPTFAHVPLVTDAKGKGFSKRLGFGTIGELRKKHIENIAVVATLAKLGTNSMPTGKETFNALVEDFSFSAFGNSVVKFSLQDLAPLNKKFIRHLTYEDARQKCDRPMDKKTWNVIRNNLNSLQEAPLWHEILFEEIISAKNAYLDHNKYFIAKAIQLLPEHTVTEKTWKDWTNNIRNETGKTGRDLFLPLRLALTGRNSGPEMEKILPLLGRKKILQRLKSVGGQALLRRDTS